ncbi:nucleoside-diphosphate sugar epimerase/dehydratase [Paenibacillus sp. LHD-117]|uniref:polysaccharide biosynthesis protein n=1 Tax=Paenibacillus sp. LHD-117 TaxID=3071412 RepID=UPI0027E0756A|nr:nucleoside-diphosphate sugar epimerase/dehydratase [Paenibacillus sp. LHD-117]MDQ6423276.1 nucleoside-diphosphate sugar epimerase/dehydratase [Paenibacillus sp. LHD-117]
MTYRRRLSLLVLLDSAIVVAAMALSRLLLGPTYEAETPSFYLVTTALLAAHHTFFFAYKLYKKAWEYASVGELVIILKAVTLSVAAAGLAQLAAYQHVSFRLLAAAWLIHLMLVGGSRLIWRIVRGSFNKQSGKRKRTLIVGAGSAGTMLVRQLLSNSDTELYPVAFVDDDPHKQNLDIMGIPVCGSVKGIGERAKELQIDNIVIAIPSLSKKQLYDIYTECARTSAKTQTIPMLEDLATGRISVTQFRDVRVEDLLGREPVELDIDSISGYVTRKVVLVTGAGGSIGSEVCRQISRFLPEKLVLLGHGENSIYAIEMELKEMFKDTNIKFFTEIADLQDADKMTAVMLAHRPQVVYHAAAHKHVPLMERNPEEAFKNNVVGTLNTARAASKARVETFVMISTDKAVNPTSVMGATKRLAEMIIQHMDRVSHTNFVAVRFGNVLGSRGSVIPLFQKQIAKGGPITVTHPDMVRYFMTIPEASRLVIQAGALARGGEIFVLDMGEPVRITDLAQNVIRMSGYAVEEIGIVYTGIRPGEKLFEEMLKDNEVTEQQVYPKIYIGKASDILYEEIEAIIAAFPAMNGAELKVRLLDLANSVVRESESKLATITG